MLNLKKKEIYRAGEYSLQQSPSGTIHMYFNYTWCSREPSLERGRDSISSILIANAHDGLTYKMGRPQYAPSVHEIQEHIDKYIASSERCSFGKHNVNFQQDYKQLTV